MVHCFIVFLSSGSGLFGLLSVRFCIWCLAFFYLMVRPRHRSTLFPYTTLFRSGPALRVGHRGGVQLAQSRTCAMYPDRKSTRLNSSHGYISYAVLCLKTKIDLRASGSFPSHFCFKLTQIIFISI